MQDRTEPHPFCCKTSASLNHRPEGGAGRYGGQPCVGTPSSLEDDKSLHLFRADW